MAPTKSPHSSAAEKNSQNLLNRLSDYAKKEVEKKFKTTSVFSDVEQRLGSFPTFDKDEIVHGKILGRGQFGVVREVTMFRLSDETSMNISVRKKCLPSVQNQKKSGICVNSKEFLQRHCIRNCGRARYAVKTLREENFDDPNLYVQATIDMAMEAYFLSKVTHTNIVKMRALSSDEMCHNNFFMVMDRLYDTLDRRVRKWKAMKKKCSGLRRKILDRRGAIKNHLVDERLTVAFDLAGALSYLHSLKIMHRDLKPDNIGFDIRGDVKIFDFGMARELGGNDRFPDSNGLYSLTGRTGTIRYMAPEVYGSEPYNEKADMYSFCLIVWYLFALEVPFAKYNVRMFESIVFQRMLRPTISRKWPVNLQKVLKMGFSPSIGARCDASFAVQLLREDLSCHRLRASRDRFGDAADPMSTKKHLQLAHVKRRSTHICPSRFTNNCELSVEADASVETKT